jgi:hypothetical protein
MCEACWAERFPQREPTRTVERYQEEACCFCGKPNASGVYYRKDPAETPCKGEGPGHVGQKSQENTMPPSGLLNRRNPNGQVDIGD